MNENIGVSLIFLGIALVFLGIIILTIEKNKSKVEAGGVVFIGPFPVFFGATSTTIAVIVAVISIIFLILALWGMIK